MDFGDHAEIIVPTGIGYQVGHSFRLRHLMRQYAPPLDYPADPTANNAACLYLGPPPRKGRGICDTTADTPTLALAVTQVLGGGLA